MLNLEYCSNHEDLDICKRCQRNDRNRLKAVSLAMQKSSVKLIHANPRKIGGTVEKCNMFLMEEINV